MDFENEGVIAETAEPQETKIVTETDTGESDFVETSTAEETAKPQTAEVNAQFADKRRKQELEKLRNEFANTNEENRQLKQELEQFKARTQKALSPFVEAPDLDNMLLIAEAQAQGITPEQLASIQAKQKEDAEKQAQIDAELEHYRNLEKEYQAKEAERLVLEDLKALQSLDPKIKSIDELGEEFVKLRFTINPLTGNQYSVKEIYTHLKSKIKPIPPTSGALNAEAEGKKEIDYMKMSDAEYEKHYNKIVYGG